jgi:hypothetical protein
LSDEKQNYGDCQKCVCEIENKKLSENDEISYASQSSSINQISYCSSDKEAEFPEGEVFFMKEISKEENANEGNDEGDEHGYCDSSGDSCIEKRFQKRIGGSEFLVIEKIFRKLIYSEEGEDKE